MSNKEEKTGVGMTRGVGGLTVSEQEAMVQSVHIPLESLALERARKKYKRSKKVGVIVFLIWILYYFVILSLLTRLLVGRDIIQAIKLERPFLNDSLLFWNFLGVLVGVWIILHNDIHGRMDAHFQIKRLSLSKPVTFAVTGVALVWLVNMVVMRISWWCMNLHFEFAFVMACFTEFFLTAFGYLVSMLMVRIAVVPLSVLEKEEKAILGITEQIIP